MSGDKNQSVLVTGASQRIGKAIALTLAKQGYHVIIHYLASQEDAKVTKNEITNDGGSAEIWQCDLADYDAVEKSLGKLCEIMPPLRHIVNNASLFTEDSLFDFTENSLADHINTNTRSAMQMGRILHKIIPNGKTGSICNIIDAKIFSMDADYFSYTMSKYMLHGATEAMAMALSPKVRVNGISPGLMLLSGDQSPENFDVASQLNLNNSPNKIVDIARTILHCIETNSLNATIIPVDGGQRMMRFGQDIARYTYHILDNKK